MVDHILLRRAFTSNEVNIPNTSNGHQYNLTGDGTSVLPEWNQILSSYNMTYDSSTRKIRALTNGIYVITASIPIAAMHPTNTAIAGWFHAGTIPAHEPFFINANAWEIANNAGSIPGGGSNIYAALGTHIATINIAEDPFIWVNVKVGGETTKNITMLYDAFFSVVKVS